MANRTPEVKAVLKDNEHLAETTQFGLSVLTLRRSGNHRVGTVLLLIFLVLYDSGITQI